jgi:hypothetical protein
MAPNLQSRDIRPELPGHYRSIRAMGQNPCFLCVLSTAVGLSVPAILSLHLSSVFATVRVGRKPQRSIRGRCEVHSILIRRPEIPARTRPVQELALYRLVSHSSSSFRLLRSTTYQASATPVPLLPAGPSFSRGACPRESGYSISEAFLSSNHKRSARLRMRGASTRETLRLTFTLNVDR